MKKFYFFLIFSLWAFSFSATRAANNTTIDETIEAAFAAEEESKFQEVVDLLVPIIDEIPADSVQEKSDVLSSITVSYFRLGDIDKALKYGKECLQFDEQSGINENLSSSLNNLASICLSSDRLEEAEAYLYRSLSIERDLGRTDKQAIRLGMLSEVYTKMNRLEDAMDRIQQALALDREGGREEKVAVRLSQLGTILTNMCRFKEAENCLKEAVELHRKHQNLSSLAISLISLATTERDLFEIKAAEKNLKECIELTEQLGMKQVRLAAYLELSRLYNLAKDPRAYDYLNQFMVLRDSIVNEQIQQQISELKVSYETKEKEQEIALQKETIKNQQILYISLGIMLIIAIVALFFAHRSNKLKEQNLQLKDRFLQLVSHDLKNPAIAQQKNLYGLLKCHKVLEPEVMDEQLLSMTKAANAQVDLLLDLLDWARLQTGKLEYTPSQLDLSLLTKKVAEQHMEQAKLKQIEVAVETQGEDHLVTADRQMIATLLRNVLSNAIKFTPENGKITITIDQKSVLIKDNGIGFDTSHINSQLGTSGEQGTSLGLNLAYQMARINHANLNISSEKSIGTTVKLAF